MSELNENVNETEAIGLDDVMDTNISGGTLEFVKENGAGLALLGLAAIGGYELCKKGVTWIKSKLPVKASEKQTLKDRLKAKRLEKQVKKDETPEKKS